MFIGVIIPCVQREMYYELLHSILHNTMRPNQIITIDNSQYGITPVNVPNCCMNYVRNAPRQDEEGNFIPGNGTNHAWKQGISLLNPNISLVTFLNDDVYLSRIFFEKTYQTFESFPKCGYLIPAYCSDINAVKVFCDRTTGVKIQKTKERNGWAYTLNRTYLDKCPPIPEELTIWYGDNWYADLCNVYGYKRLIRWDNPVYHYGGTTSKQEIRRATHKRMSKIRNNEHASFLRAMRKLRALNETGEPINETNADSEET